MKNSIQITLLIFVLIGCTKQSSRLEQALNFAGNNRTELEKVLDHYKNKPADSLKYRAACFLIENMPYHFSCNNMRFEFIKKEISEMVFENGSSIQTVYKTLEKKYGKIYPNDYIVNNDAKSISSLYLIKNIEHAFYVWEKQPWGKFYSFDVFCKEILPYRISNEPLEDWRDSYYNYFQPILDSLLIKQTPAEACKLLYKVIEKQKWLFVDDLPTPHLGGKSLLEKRFGSCREYSDFMTYIMRALGIPGGVDLIVQNPDLMYTRHYWNYVRDTTNKIIEFELYGVPLDFQGTRKKKGKVYRHNFDIQENSLSLNFPGKKIPESLKDIFISDVTSEYYENREVELYFNKEERKDQIVYLSVFGYMQWIPITWTRIESGKAYFKNIEPNIIYCPTFYIAGQNMIAGAPFILKKDGGIHFYDPDTVHTNTISIRRKFRGSFLHKEMEKISVGSKFQGSNEPGFTNWDDLYVITEGVGPYYSEIDIDCQKAYRYVRFLSSNKYYFEPRRINRINDTSYCNIAEIEFYTSEFEELTGKIIGTDGSTRNNPQNSKHTVFDKNPLTYFESDKPYNAWVGLDLGEPQKIEKIRFIFRNDDNSIREGDSYELFYFSGRGKVSLGIQTGNREQKLVYANVPENAVLWLHNYTRGKEERIFTLENGKQAWW